MDLLNQRIRKRYLTNPLARITHYGRRRWKSMFPNGKLAKRIKLGSISIDETSSPSVKGRANQESNVETLGHVGSSSSGLHNDYEVTAEPMSFLEGHDANFHGDNKMVVKRIKLDCIHEPVSPSVEGRPLQESNVEALGHVDSSSGDLQNNNEVSASSISHPDSHDANFHGNTNMVAERIKPTSIHEPSSPSPEEQVTQESNVADNGHAGSSSGGMHNNHEVFANSMPYLHSHDATTLQGDTNMGNGIEWNLKAPNQVSKSANECDNSDDTNCNAPTLGDTSSDSDDEHKRWSDYRQLDWLDSTDDETDESFFHSREGQSYDRNDDEGDMYKREWNDDGLYSSSDEEVDSIRRSTIDSKESNNKAGVVDDTLFQKVEINNTVCPATMLRMIFRHSFKNNTCFTGIVDQARLLNTCLGQNVLPETRYLFDKVCNANTEFTLHAVCPTCSKHVGTFIHGVKIVKCSNCNTPVNVSNRSNSNFFATIEPSHAIRDLLQAHEDYYDYVVKEWKPSTTYIRDIQDSKLYQDFLDSLPPEDRYLYVTGAFNADGGMPFECSLYTVWPIYIMLNELPPQARFENLILVGLWVGQKKPVMSVFLDKFVEEMNKLSISGIEITIKNERRVIKLYLLLSPDDTMARFEMNGTVIFFAEYGCDWCLIKGYTYERSRRYPYEFPRSPNRDILSHMVFAQQALENGSPCFGVNSVSPLVNLRGFDNILGFTTEYMHQSDNGLFKHFTKRILRKMKPAQRALADKYLTEVRVPTHLRRLTRPLKNSPLFKCREWENWGLYCSIPILSEVIPDKKLLRHWGLMVDSVHYGLKDCISYVELNLIDSNFDEFVRDTEALYSLKDLTYTTHQSLHVAEGIYNWGPSWTHSAFPFESEMKKLLQSFHSEKGMILQMIRYLNLRRFDQILKQKLDPDSSEIVETYCNSLASSRVNRVLKLKEITYLGRRQIVRQSYADRFKVKPSTLIFVRCVIKGVLFMSEVKKNRRTCNYFAQLKNGQFVKILNFLVNVEDRQELTICQFLEVEANCYARTVMNIKSFQNHEHIVKTEEIHKICVQVNVGDKSYITPVPNMLRY